MTLPLKITKHGQSELTIFLEGPNALQWGWSFYNHGATNNPEMTELCENKVSFLTTEENLKKALFGLFIGILSNSNATDKKGTKGGFASEARMLAELEFDAVTDDEAELRKKRRYSVETHNLGNIVTRDENAFFAGCKA